MSTQSKSPKKPEWDIKDKMIDDNKVEALLAKLKAKGVNENQICKEYGVAFIETLTVEQWTNAMRRLDKTPDRKNRKFKPVGGKYGYQNHKRAATGNPNQF